MKVKTKPVVKEARQLLFGNQEEIKQWCGGKTWSRPLMRAVTGLTIHTLEGGHNAEFGDWIIKGLKGEFYPCKPDVFEMTYEPAEYSEWTLLKSKELKSQYGLKNSLADIIMRWESYSETMCASWLFPDKDSVEQVFGVILEER